MYVLPAGVKSFLSAFASKVVVAWEHNEAVHQLFIDFKKAYDSIRKEAFYNILIEFRIPRNW